MDRPRSARFPQSCAGIATFTAPIDMLAASLSYVAVSTAAPCGTSAVQQLVILGHPETCEYLFKVLVVPKAAYACIAAADHGVGPGSGLRKLRCVCKSVKEALLPYIKTYSIQFALGSSANFQLQQAKRLISTTQLSSLRVLIDFDGWESMSDNYTKNQLNPARRFVKQLGASLRHVKALDVETIVFTGPIIYTPLFLHLRIKLDNVAYCMQAITQVIAGACPEVTRLRIMSPAASRILPTNLLNLTHLTLEHQGLKELSLNWSPPWPPSSLDSMFTRLTSLTLPPSSSGIPAVCFYCISGCVSLVYLDYGDHLITADMWAHFPAGLCELRCELCVRPSQCLENVILQHLRRCVFLQRGSSMHITCLVDVLAISPSLMEIVLLETDQAQTGPAVVSATAAVYSLQAIPELHTRLSSGLKLSTSHKYSSSANHTSTVFNQSFILQLSEFFPNGLDFTPFSEMMAGVNPMPFYTNVRLILDADDLTLLPAVFPSLCFFCLSDLEDSQQLAPLARCTCLQTLRIDNQQDIPAVQLAAALSGITSLRSFLIGPCIDAGGYTKEELDELEKLLSVNNPHVDVKRC